MWNLLANLFSKTPQGLAVKARLSEEQAISVARQAVEKDSAAQQLVSAQAVERGGRIVWIVSQPFVRGSRLSVTVDDATGEVLETKRSGVR